MPRVFSAVLVPDSARHDILTYQESDDKLMDITPAATQFLEAHFFDALWVTEDDVTTEMARAKVKKIVYGDLSLFFVYGDAAVLKSLFGRMKLMISPKHHRGVHLWILGARDATDGEKLAQYWKIWRS